MTWGKILGESDNPSKLTAHYFIANISACEKIEITNDSYIKYSTDGEKCKNCGTELQKMKDRIRLII